MFDNITSIFNIVGPFLLALIALIASRRGMAKDASEAQKDLINAQKEEILLYLREVEKAKEEIKKMKRLLATVGFLLQKNDIRLLIEEEYITLTVRGKDMTASIVVREED